MIRYQLTKPIPPATQPDTIKRINEDASETFIPIHESNGDYRDYLAWVEAGNSPEPTP